MSNLDENEQLNELMQSGIPEYPSKSRNANEACIEAPTPTRSQSGQNTDLCQWQVGANGMLRPAAKTITTLAAGAYSCRADEYGPFLVEHRLISDEILSLPETENVRVLAAIKKFWRSRARYEGHGLIFKRGILLWGPPGGGKTVTATLLTQDLIDRDGIILYCSHPKLTVDLMVSIRRIEPERPLIVILEDIDEIIGQHGEHEILSMLDGENHTSNVVYIATTNYPERLGARIVNRPSRFDERIYVGMPSELARLTYLRKAAGDKVDVVRWSQETNGLSIAHLRELVAAVLCLDQDYEDVLKRLRSMSERPKEVDGFTGRVPGFGLVGTGAQQRQ